MAVRVDIIVQYHQIYLGVEWREYFSRTNRGRKWNIHHNAISVIANSSSSNEGVLPEYPESISK
jgi:hypothetical protein